MSYNSKYTGSGVDNVLDKVIPAIAPTQTADGKEGLVPAAPKDSYLGNKVLHSDMTWKEAVTKEYVDNAVNSASWKKIIVDTLPDESAADSNTIYLVRDALASSESGNVYNEYILVTPEEGDPYFETLGSVSTKVDVKYIELDLFNADSGTLTEDQYQHIADCYADKVVLSVQGTEIKASNLSYENEVYSIRLFFLNKQNEDTRLGIELTDIDIAADHTFTVTRSSYFVDNAGMAYSAYMASNPAVVNTLVDLPIDGYNVIANIDTASTLSVSSGMVDGRELQIRVNNTASTELKLTLPTQDPYVNLSAESVTIAPGGFIEINIWYVGGQYLLRVGVSEADEEDIKPVNADWEATSGLAQILNRPNLHSVAESGNYNELENKPDIPDVSGFVESAGAASSDADGLTFNLQKKMEL